MVNAFVLVNISEKNIREIGNSLMALDGVTEVYPIAGEYDMLVVIRVNDNVTLSKIITDQIIHKQGIRHTKTLFALDVYSKFDLSTIFGIQ